MSAAHSGVAGAVDLFCIGQGREQRRGATMQEAVALPAAMHAHKISTAPGPPPRIASYTNKSSTWNHNCARVLHVYRTTTSVWKAPWDLGGFDPGEKVGDGPGRRWSCSLGDINPSGLGGVPPCDLGGVHPGEKGADGPGRRRRMGSRRGRIKQEHRGRTGHGEMEQRPFQRRGTSAAEGNHAGPGRMKLGHRRGRTVPATVTWAARKLGLERLLVLGSRSIWTFQPVELQILY
jgi:hypothetical protein